MTYTGRVQTGAYIYVKLRVCCVAEQLYITVDLSKYTIYQSILISY